MKKIIPTLIFTVLVISGLNTFSQQIVITFFGEVKDVTGQKYKTIHIGDQNWMADNLNVKKFKNGDKIPRVKSEYDWVQAAKNKEPAWCYLNKGKLLKRKYGILYNWYAISDPRGLAPEGWHISTERDIEILSKELGGYRVAGGKLKGRACYNWMSDRVSVDGSSKFEAIPNGFRDAKGKFHQTSSYGSYTTSWWTTTQSGTGSYAYYYSLSQHSNSLSSGAAQPKGYGCNVRCVKDEK